MKILKINDNDNVAVVLQGEEIPQGHKVALADIKSGQGIIKYGNIIGIATKDIKKDEWVHTHNIRTSLSEKNKYVYNPNIKEVSINTDRHFFGYLRENGKAGTRNEIWIIPTVGCIGKTADKIAEMTKEFAKSYCDDIISFSHPYGCSQLGDDELNTQRILTGLINNPNAGAILVLGLGCENNNIHKLKQVLGEYDENRVKFLECQSVENELEESVKVIKDLCLFTEKYKRQSLPASLLVAGLKCGGSDGFSGITANPLVGLFSDMLIQNGGTAVMTEVPEMFGAEKDLLNRCENIELFNKGVQMINDFKDYFINNKQPIYENPSPGNKEGGISTLEEKSLGCTQKSGTSPVIDILKYGGMVDKTGLNLLSGPGNDLVATTALTAAGANIILFTTGRGTPFGAPVPTMKISTNSKLYHLKKNWIDFNAGVLLETGNLQELADAFFVYVLKVASGERVKNEINEYKEIAIFKTGITL